MNKIRKAIKSDKFGRLTILVLLVTVIFVWTVFFQKPNSNLHIFFFDVGQGDAILVQQKSTQILIDGGPDNKILSKLGRAMPFYDKDIEYMLLTHPHSDHLSGLIDVIKSYHVKSILMTDAVHTTLEYLEFLKQIKDKNIPTSMAKTGEKISLENNVELDILYPDKPVAQVDNLNNTSIVSQLKYDKFTVIFPGDAEKSILDQLAQKYGNNLASNVLKVPHHGSKNGLSSSFFNKVSPELVIISVGKNNQFGHPSPQLLKFFENIKVLRTDEKGDIELETNGQNFWLKTQK
ncbi:MAG: hypothetical protein COX39_03355 [Candidatus Nealsonbacteria bacterium CG23_combo_of_CG06-09_8_20_14_all_40_13]|uniref:Metallo-beta-lactamase domain-containing protein n=1 Tax=Candidatus Nealsonbacteria bacterium CG23_combo_of_CG06-09_8_20_14_all_40_13 TaxID=1974724 RepID=A0A2G9YQ34_9BACT|nr:MAG: hypothetical protein COX39_03355 [Candidatus Nealsonbacteria bacterium CG23_combo_of_CG06-09_8_20_14_all_40_13]PIR71046.1 MAG: hypothetical protein COU44_01665 [Candidatus Nealsonbacteria bacterium CG10_big_fil_rev_8_21_14_0_10_40_24]PIU43181.1 MAG: hypothetical protein COS97_02335 [Candidatus Nealsonbacteria bacterium CG07_land_8_20_14_0_80_40_10]